MRPLILFSLEFRTVTRTGGLFIDVFGSRENEMTGQVMQIKWSHGNLHDDT